MSTRVLICFLMLINRVGFFHFRLFCAFSLNIYEFNCQNNLRTWASSPLLSISYMNQRERKESSYSGQRNLENLGKRMHRVIYSHRPLVSFRRASKIVADHIKILHLSYPRVEQLFVVVVPLSTQVKKCGTAMDLKV